VTGRARKHHFNNESPATSVLLVLDNIDSFVHNLARMLRLAGAATRIVRSDWFGPDDIDRLAPAGIVISPGPGAPAEAGCSVEVVRRFAETTPILGVCLGHQAIAEAFGARIVRTPEPLHGRVSRVEHDGSGLFAGVPPLIEACRYHSLAIDEPSLPAELRVTASSDDGVVMAIAHRTRPVFGVQFHPEAILTTHGERLLANFVRVAESREGA
jgi:anthranilate synthase/aminodeoxychorismate synthase-like glutamine amidotransferase